MQWLAVSIFTTRNAIDMLCSRLMDLGIAGFEIEDKEDFEEFLENNKQYWDYVDDELRRKMSGETRVKIYVENNKDGLNLLESIKADLSALKSLDTENAFGSLEVRCESLSEEDWENNWKQFFKPIYVGDRLVIKPEWETIPDGDGKIVFNIDPGMTFGSGQHETTRLCVENLINLVKKGDKVLDLGCGSGILSIISLMLGGESALAIDIDPNCKKIAMQNANLNGIDESTYTVWDGNIITDTNLKEKTLKKAPFNIVVANIVADVIIPLSKDVRQYMADDAIFIASGIIEHRFEEVKKAIENDGFEILDVQKDKDWYAIVSR